MKKRLSLLIGSIICISLAATGAQARISTGTLVPPVEFSNSAGAVNASISSLAQSVSTGNVTRPATSLAGVNPTQETPATSTKAQSSVSNSSTKTKVKPTSSPVVNQSTNTVINGRANAIIITARQYIGVPYVFGGATPQGFDCSGFVQYVFGKNGISLPRVSRDQFTIGKSVGLDSLQPADLVFFSLAKNGVVDHVGIYIGGGQFINAASSKGVTIYTLGPYWKSYFIGAKRVL